nr:PREDICTED: regucalcin-like [Megachile rotundata]
MGFTILDTMQHIIYNSIIFGLLFVTFVHSGNLPDKYENSKELTIKPIVGRFEHSEGPHWDDRTQKLYFVDIEAQKICRFCPVTEQLTCINIERGPVGFAIPVQGEPDKLVAGVATGFVLINWDGQTNITKSPPETLATVDTDRNGTRWNDGKADSSGRFWGGTIGPEVNDVVIPNQASFYRIDSTLKPKRELIVTNSNGLAWNLQDNTLYYIDTPTRQVAAFDFDSINGIISNKRIAFDFKKYNISGIPDGMTIDTDGHLWIAVYNGGCVLNVDPETGNLLRTVNLPAVKVTSVAFGGPKREILYVTTSARGISEEDLKKQPYAGYVYAVHGLGVHGLIANSFKL